MDERILLVEDDPSIREVTAMPPRPRIVQVSWRLKNSHDDP